MSNITRDQIWTSKLNDLESVQQGFDRIKTGHHFITVIVCAFDVFFMMGVLHGIHDQTDQKVHHGKGG